MNELDLILFILVSDLFPPSHKLYMIISWSIWSDNNFTLTIIKSQSLTAKTLWLHLTYITYWMLCLFQRYLLIWQQEQQARLTALIPDNCWPMFMIIMEASCQRRERWDSRERTDKCPSAFSDWSSRRISAISASTLSRPRRRCSALSDRTYRIL